MAPTGKSIKIGELDLGGKAPVRIQSMGNVDTNDIGAAVDQCVRMIDAGAELVRLTTQGSREVQSIALVREELRRRGYDCPVVADIHFRPGLALEAVGKVEKIRINPGNYIKGGELSALLPELIDACKAEETAIRIGVNHGSLAPEILEKYGDSPEGMVESAMQFLRICRDMDMDKLVVSMKSSNPRVMMQAVRLLASTMREEGMDYPLHLGVTEAGDGIEGRIKSVVGMAPLLLDGLGDTLRVSLTEAPENELPVARLILDLFPKAERQAAWESLSWDPYRFERRIAREVGRLGGGSRLKIISEQPPVEDEDITPAELDHTGVRILDLGNAELRTLKTELSDFCKQDAEQPIVLRHRSQEKDPLRYRMQLAGELGYFLDSGAIDAVWAGNPNFDTAFINEALLVILQAAGARMSRTEYIACPSCGRTHFDILARLKEIREATAHLKPIKIGVMGCIVNGPGEMADADYGYVGAGRGKVSLYRRQKAVALNIPEKEALEALIKLIRDEGDWQEVKK